MTILDRIRLALHIWNEPPRRTSSPTPFEPGSPEFHGMMEAHGLTSKTHDLTEEQARADLAAILSSNRTDDEKYAALYALMVDTENNTERGIASPVISEILAAQGEIVLKGKP